MPETLLERYRAMIRSGEIRPDQAQALAVEKLQLLANRLASYAPPAKTDIFSFFTRRSGEVPDGLYIFGGVGRGKTMLMDLFFTAVPFPKKRRVHFHEFMSEIHDLIALARKSHAGDPVPQVGEKVAREAPLLCFDELQVTDIADAMILGRLFGVLFDRGTVIVATSNSAPWDLYRSGLNRDLFLPFVELIEANMEVMQLEVGARLPAGPAQRRLVVFHAARPRSGRGNPQAVADLDRPRPGRTPDSHRQGPRGGGARSRDGRGPLRVRRSLQQAAGRQRLPGHRPQLPHPIHRERARS